MEAGSPSRTAASKNSNQPQRQRRSSYHGSFAAEIDFVARVDGVVHHALCECYKHATKHYLRMCRPVCNQAQKLRFGSHPPSPEVAGSPHGDMWHENGRPFAMSAEDGGDCGTLSSPTKLTISGKAAAATEQDIVHTVKVQRMWKLSKECENTTGKNDNDDVTETPRKRWSYSSSGGEEFQHNEFDHATQQYIPHTPIPSTYLPPSPGFVTPESSSPRTSSGSPQQPPPRNLSSDTTYHTPTDQPIRRAPPPWHANRQWVPRGALRPSAPVHPSTFAPGATARRRLPTATPPQLTIETVLNEVRNTQSTLRYINSRINALTAAVHDLALNIHNERNQ